VAKITKDIYDAPFRRREGGKKDAVVAAVLSDRGLDRSEEGRRGNKRIGKYGSPDDYEKLQ